MLLCCILSPPPMRVCEGPRLTAVNSFFYGEIAGIENPMLDADFLLKVMFKVLMPGVFRVCIQCTEPAACSILSQVYLPIIDPWSLH